MVQATLEKSSLAGAWSWTFFANGFRILTQGLVFFCVLSRLGPEPYGAMMVITSVACVLATFSGLGLGPLLLQTVARNPELLRSAWIKVSRSTFVTGSLLTLIGMGICQLFFPSYLDIFSLFLIFFSEIVLSRIVDNSASVFQAKQFLGLSAEVKVMAAVLRSLAAVVFLSSLATATPENWILLSSSAVLLSAAWGYFRVTRIFRSLPLRPLSSNQMQVSESIHFALETLGENLSAEMQRMVLATFGGAYVTGIYAAAYRAIEIACLPVRSLVYSVGARVLIEALASGVPVMGFNLGGTPELARPGETGYVVSSEEDFESKLHYLVSNPREVRGLSGSSRAFAAKLIEEVWAPKLVSLYEKVLRAA